MPFNPEGNGTASRVDLMSNHGGHQPPSMVLGSPRQNPQTSPIRLSTFWATEPDLWFIEVEAEFTTYGVTDDSRMYDATISALTTEAIQEVSDILRAPHSTAKYPQLKANLIKRFTDSVDQRLHKLLTELRLGDQKASQLLRVMRKLAGGKATDELLRRRWLALLPGMMGTILKTLQGDRPLEHLVDAADLAMESQPDMQVMATGLHSPLSRHSSNPSLW